MNVLDECTKVNSVETFSGVVKDGVVDVVYGCSKLVAGDGEDKFIRGPCFAGKMLLARNSSG